MKVYYYSFCTASYRLLVNKEELGFVGLLCLDCRYVENSGILFKEIVKLFTGQQMFWFYSGPNMKKFMRWVKSNKLPVI